MTVAAGYRESLDGVVENLRASGMEVEQLAYRLPPPDWPIQ
jgi:hypothetical protein